MSCRKETLALVIRCSQGYTVDGFVEAARLRGMPFLRRFLPVASEAHLEAPDLQRPIPLYDPAGVLGRLNRTFRRRLSDRVEDLFHDACVAGDLTTAEELLTVMENMQKRRLASDGDRRIDDEVFTTARNELARRKYQAGRATRG